MALVLACSTPACQSESYRLATTTTPPPVAREFRGAWIPTVVNSCWPSQPGLSTAQQKAELIALLDRAVELKLNAVIFQVRPECDALYKSSIEPWSEYLTGTQGKAPSPFYDPLEFAVTEAHKRGLELHAWFNPYRARHKSARSPVAPNHISRVRPDLVRRYGNYLWLDPGERDVQDYSIRVVLDVVKRYDIDAVHFDDYFYPYPERNSSGHNLEFPDNASWRKFGAKSGMSRDDWRRHNVDQFVQRVYHAIHAEKPYVKFGISPFGIWRPKHPPTIEGLDAYDTLYADARKWLREGWCDYMAPQLYWKIDPAPQSFPVLLKWWSKENVKKRHLWPGLNSYACIAGTFGDPTPWPPSEITKQIELTRKQSGADGQIHWNAKPLMQVPALAAELRRDTYRQPALVPKFSWLDAKPPLRPKVTATISGKNVTAKWSAAGTEQPWHWVVQWKEYGDWKTHILPANKAAVRFDLKPGFIAVTAVDRCGNTSSPNVLKLVQ